jgi:hypothetical protein
MTVIEACQAVGIARSTFYYIVIHHPEAIATFQEMQEAAQLQEIEMLLVSQIAVLEKVIEDALSDATKPRHRLAIYKELVKRTEELMREVKIHLAEQTFIGQWGEITKQQVDVQGMAAGGLEFGGRKDSGVSQDIPAPPHPRGAGLHWAQALVNEYQRQTLPE